MVVFGKGADAQVDPRQVQPLARTQLAPDEHGALDVLAFDADDLQLNDAVIQEQGVASLDDCGQALEGHEGALPIADDLVRGERERIAPASTRSALPPIAQSSSWDREGRP
jgi:hypothetical protein